MPDHNHRCRDLATNSPKQADGQASGSNEGGDKSLLRRNLPVETVVLAAPVVLVPDTHAEISDKRSNEECDEGQLTDSERHAVHLDVDQRERLEPGVEDGVDETLLRTTSVQRDRTTVANVGDTNDEEVVGKDNGLSEVQDERFDQSHFGGIAEGHLSLSDFSLRFEIFVAGELSEPLGPSQKDVLGGSLQRRRSQL